MDLLEAAVDDGKLLRELGYSSLKAIRMLQPIVHLRGDLDPYTP